MNLYDFDKTIYAGDSSTDFFFYCLCKHPKIILNFPRMIVGALQYVLHIRNKTQMKEKIFAYLKYVPDVDKLVKSFWETHECFIKEFYQKKDHSKDIIISASPEFLLEPICKKLKVKDLIGSEVNKKTGKFNGLNCHDEEKVKRLYDKHGQLKIKEAYSDSDSDLPILRLADKAYKVKGNKIKLYKIRNFVEK